MKKYMYFMVISLLALLGSCEKKSDVVSYTEKGIVYDQLLQIDSDEQNGFLWPYLLYIPEAVKKDNSPAEIMVIPNNTGRSDDNEAVHLSKAINDMGRFSMLYNTGHQRIGLMPVFPRYSYKNGGSKIYTHALDRDSVVTAQGEIERIDRQLVNMLNHARNLLAAEAAISFDFRVIIFGFSASAHFADRFTLLYPHQVQTLVVGGFNGHIAFPMAQYDGLDLIYPVGTYDYFNITQNNFDYQSYDAIPKFYFIGAKDTNDDVPYGDGYDNIERNLIHRLLGEVQEGESVALRLSPIKRILESQGLMVNRSFKVYEKAGHEFSEEMMADVIEFINSSEIKVRNY